MDEQWEDWESDAGYVSCWEHTGSALLGASAVVALLITLATGFPLLAPIVFPFAFLAALLFGLAIGMPIFLAAHKLGKVNTFSAAFGGFLTGAALPALQLLGGNAYAGQSIVLLGAAGMIGGVAFLSFLGRS